MKTDLLVFNSIVTVAYSFTSYTVTLQTSLAISALTLLYPENQLYSLLLPCVIQDRNNRNLIMLKNYCPPPTSGANNTWRSYIPNFIPVKLIDNSKSKPAKKEQVLGETTAQPKVSRRIEYPELYKDVSMTKAPCVNPTETYQTEALSSLYLPEDAMRSPLTELDMTKLETWLAERSIVLRRGSSLTMDGPTAKLCKKYAGDFDSLISKIANQEEAKVAASKESGPDDNEWTGLLTKKIWKMI